MKLFTYASDKLKKLRSFARLSKNVDITKDLNNNNINDDAIANNVIEEGVVVDEIKNTNQGGK